MGDNIMSGRSWTMFIIALLVLSVTSAIEIAFYIVEVFGG